MGTERQNSGQLVPKQLSKKELHKSVWREVLVSENQEAGRDRWDWVPGESKGSLPQPCHLLRSKHTSLGKTRQINFTRPWFMKLHNKCMQ